MGARKVQGPEEAEALGMRDFFRMERAETRIEAGQTIRTFWNEYGRGFELDARRQRWREVPGIGPRPDPTDGWNPLTV
jgi:hypothetical protein